MALNLLQTALKSRSPIVPCNGQPSNSVGFDGEFAIDVNTGITYFKDSVLGWISGINLAGGAGKWTLGQQYVGLVATRCKAPTAGGYSVKSHMARTIHTARTNITQIGAAFANWYCNGLTEVGAGGPCTITASIEYPLGSPVTRLTFGGQTSGTAYDFSTLESDLAILAIPAGAQFAIREYRIYPGNGDVVFTGFTGNSSIGPDTSAGDCYVYTGATDLTGSTGAFASTDGSSYAPAVAVFGPTNQPSYAIIGDSIFEGYQDTPNGNLYVGGAARSIGPTRAYTNLAKFGEMLSAVAGASTGFNQRSAIATKFSTHILCNYGVNDLFSNAVSSNYLIRNLLTLRQQFPNQWFYQTTITPETTSTDSWATPGNQTTVSAAAETNRQQANNFLRSGIGGVGVGGFDGVFDVTSIIETNTNTGIWKSPGYTIDGVHPVAMSYGLIATSQIIQVQ